MRWEKEKGTEKGGREREWRGDSENREEEGGRREGGGEH